MPWGKIFFSEGGKVLIFVYSKKLDISVAERSVNRKRRKHVHLKMFKIYILKTFSFSKIIGNNLKWNI